MRHDVLQEERSPAGATDPRSQAQALPGRRRLRRRLPLRAAGAAPRRGGQDPAARRKRARPPPVHHRGGPHGPAVVTPLHRVGLRGRDSGGGTQLPHHGVLSPAPLGQAGHLTALDAHTRPGDRNPGGGRGGDHSPSRLPPPRHQAGQYPRHPFRAPCARRLRDRRTHWTQRRAGRVRWGLPTMGLTRAAARPGESDTCLGRLRSGRDHLHPAGGALAPRRRLRLRPQRPALDARPGTPPTDSPDRTTRRARAARAGPDHGDVKVPPRTVCQRRCPGSSAATGSDRPAAGHHPAGCHGGGAPRGDGWGRGAGLHDAAAGRYGEPRRADRNGARCPQA